jgi:1-acyl-sn-glycerol-3-phosphate acyltransferase
MEKRHIINLVILIIFFLFIIKCGIKKGFDNFATYWILLTLSFYIILSILQPPLKIIFIFIVMKIKALYIPIITITGVILALRQEKFKTYRMTSLAIYKNYLNLRMNNDYIPKKPTIYVANYPANYIEYLTHGLFCDKLCIVVHAPAIRFLKFIYGNNHTIPVNLVDTGSFDKVQNQVKKKIEDGYSIFSYPERDFRKRKHIYELCELRSGMFNIAKNLDITITPVCIDHIDHIYGIVSDYYFNIKIGETFNVTDIKKDMLRVEKFLKTELKKMKIHRLVK